MVLPSHFYPYWTVYDGLGKKYCDCSHEKYAIRTVELHSEYQNETFTYRRIDAPKPLPPHIVDVSAQTDLELPGQRGLPERKRRLPFEPEESKLKESKLKEIEFDYD